ncbi:carboxypeptidase-like regulatory domain-containing protein [Alkaliflexus imshenetskii]|jgi:hypothetical protein|uniref:carboxypeptidase-like regulatory domain-containing protein n=1 Tax=Alkaliflexus imshenetskii TaxID=286730 RepID=UPI0005C7904D|nr:carboxypeptidase regulatory-like domain-containing protein [Alkaliflexus imshenetskii]
MKAKATLLMFLLMVGISVYATDGQPAEPASAPMINTSLSGVVMDKCTGEALTGVEIRVDGTELRAYTDFDGKFVFEGLTPGEYKVSANLISYRSSQTNAIRIKNNELHALNLELETVNQ